MPLCMTSLATHTRLGKHTNMAGNEGNGDAEGNRNSEGNGKACYAAMSCNILYSSIMEWNENIN
jgi:hypothetical protein